MIERMKSYEDYLLWEVIYPAYLPGAEGSSVIEIGSAPGKHLVKMRDRLGCETWGLEYSPEGAAANREAFKAAGIDPGRVIEADLFDDEALEIYAGRFDIVISRGFIEHFDDPSEAIRRHLRFLRPGGRLVVSIPNMRGANYLQALLFNRRLIPIHNREIMRMKDFRALFDLEGLETVFCDYYGTAKADIFIHRKGPFTGLVSRAAEAFQALQNLLFRTVLRERGLETPVFSPNLLFIGRKKH
jgi:SAM-dependent methyltransferase